MNYQQLLEQAIQESKITKEKLSKCHAKVQGISVESLGWERFLTRWNDEFFEQFIRTRLEFGWYPDLVDGTVAIYKIWLQKYGLDDGYLEIFEGGLEYPKGDLAKADSNVTERIEKIKVFAKLELKEKNHSGDLGDHLEIKKYANFEFDIDDAIIVNDGLFFRPVTENEIALAKKEIFNKAVDKTRAITDSRSFAEAEKRLSGLEFDLPKDYQQFLSVSNGWLLKSFIITPDGFLSPRVDQIILPLRSLIYFGNLELGDDLFGYYVWGDIDDEENKRVPTSLIFSIHGNGDRFISCFDFANHKDGERLIYSKDTSSPLIDTYGNFTEFMEKRYVDSIAQVHCEYEELSEMKKDGRWVPLSDRGKD